MGLGPSDEAIQEQQEAEIKALTKKYFSEILGRWEVTAIVPGFNYSIEVLVEHDQKFMVHGITKELVEALTKIGFLCTPIGIPLRRPGTTGRYSQKLHADKRKPTTEDKPKEAPMHNRGQTPPTPEAPKKERIIDEAKRDFKAGKEAKRIVDEQAWDKEAEQLLGNVREAVRRATREARSIAPVTLEFLMGANVTPVLERLVILIEKEGLLFDKKEVLERPPGSESVKEIIVYGWDEEREEREKTAKALQSRAQKPKETNGAPMANYVDAGIAVKNSTSDILGKNRQ